MSSRIESFLRSQKHGSSEGRLAEAYRKAVAAFEIQQAALLKCLRVEKTGSKLVPIFTNEAGELAGNHYDAERRVIEVKSDIEAFLDIIGNDVSLDGLSSKLVRTRRTISEVTFEANAVRERSVRTNPAMSPNEAESLEVVQTAFDKRDRLKAELEPIAADLQSRVTKAKTILEKYRPFV